MISFSSRTKRQSGFSLVELMTVIAVIGVLAAVSVPAFRGLASAEGLSAQAAVVANLLTEARTQAITLRTPVQMRIATSSWAPGGTNDITSCYRKVSLWKLQQSNPNNPDDTTWSPTWQQLTPWQSVGPNAIFEPASDPTTSTPSYSFNGTSANNPNNSGYTYFLNTTTYYASGNTLTTGSPIYTGQTAVNSTTANMVAVEFLPTGALNTGSANTSSIYLLLTLGSYNGSSITYTEKQSSLSDWAQIRISSLTGEISVVRP